MAQTAEAPAPVPVELSQAHDQAVDAEQARIAAMREPALRRLLDGPYEPGASMGNYEYAEASGLLELFAYNPETGEDAIAHILSGNVVAGEDGAEIAWGFHHEPSGRFGDNPDNTYVDREAVSRIPGRDKRRSFVQPPFEPYMALPVIAGRSKVAPRTDPRTGQTELVQSKSSMFPQEYDGLMVLQAIRIAAENRDPSGDEPQPNGNILGIGYAPMIDGESLMKIRLVFAPDGQRVLSANPMVKVGGIMKLSRQAIDECLGLQ